MLHALNSHIEITKFTITFINFYQKFTLLTLCSISVYISSVEVLKTNEKNFRNNKNNQRVTILTHQGKQRKNRIICQFLTVFYPFQQSNAWLRCRIAKSQFVAKTTNQQQILIIHFTDCDSFWSAKTPAMRCALLGEDSKSTSHPSDHRIGFRLWKVQESTDF